MGFKIILLTLLVLMVVSVSGCAENTKGYDNSLVSFSYPESWSIFMDDSTPNRVQVEFEGPNIISCIVQSGGLYTGSVENDFVEGLNDYKWTKKTVNGYDFWDGVKEASPPYITRQGIFQKGNTAYFIRFYGKNSASNEYYQIVNSFKIKG